MRNWSEVSVRNVCSPTETQASHLSLNFISAYKKRKKKKNMFGWHEKAGNQKVVSIFTACVSKRKY